MKVREAAVAGLFYPAKTEQLRHDVDAMLQRAPAPAGPAPKVLILPHAGYVFSGPVAAAGCNLLRTAAASIRRVVLLGPAHRIYLEGMAVPDADAFATPLGSVPLDRESIDAIATLPGVCVSELAHQDEHSLEAQLPLLQTVLQDFTLVPVVVGRAAPRQVAAVIDAVWGGPETLVVISSDLSHYLSYEQARLMDAATCKAIINKSSKLTGEQACGAHAINGLMQAQHSQSLTVEPIALCNSGDTCGDKNKVVGYGAFSLH
jgi:AmmeMemoRadiSam system protein B